MQDKYHTYENFYLKCTNLKEISEYLISFHNHTCFNNKLKYMYYKCTGRWNVKLHAATTNLTAFQSTAV